MVSGNETRAGDGSRFAHLHFLSRQHELLVIFGGLLHNALHLLAQTAPHLQLCPLLVDADNMSGCIGGCVDGRDFVWAVVIIAQLAS